MSDRLKPCPFCGGEGVIYEYSTVETRPCSMPPARPAEVEGVVIAAKCVNRKRLRHNAMLSDYGLTLPHGEALVRQSDHIAALSAERTRADVDAADANDAERALAAVTAERDRLLAFVTECSGTAGGMVSGNRLSSRAKELIAAMAAKEA